MKSAYELAMERLARGTPSVKLSESQKKEIAELESKYKARLAEKEIFLQAEIGRAQAKGDEEALGQLEKQLSSERRVLSEKLEAEKEAVRQRSPG